MDIAVIIVGMDQWEEFTLPAIKSIKGGRVIVMDCGKEPYPKKRGVKVVRLENSPSYAYAINEGVKAAGEADWYLILNNDIKQTGDMVSVIEKLSTDSIYGRQIITERGHVWLGLWIALIPKEVWNKVGGFDEKFLLCGFEDADYCIRAKELGIDTKFADLPFYHYWGKTRWGIPNYPQVRLDNINYLHKKHGVALGQNVRVIHD